MKCKDGNNPLTRIRSERAFVSSLKGDIDLLFR